MPKYLLRFLHNVNKINLSLYVVVMFHMFQNVPKGNIFIPLTTVLLNV